MNTSTPKKAAQANDTSSAYRDPRNIITLTLWGIALASHAILVPMLIRELYQEFKKKRT